MYELFKDLGDWLVSGEQWTGPDGIGHRLAEHLQYSSSPPSWPPRSPSRWAC